MSKKNLSVRVRMYNVGFGDCFLLRFPAPDRERKVLIDCGMHQSGAGPIPMKEIVDRIIEDVNENGLPKIDLVIATHRHRDHVSGFVLDAWEEVEVGEVWMPWTENPQDPKAREIRERQSRAAQRLDLALQALQADSTGIRDSLLAIAQNNLLIFA